MEKPETHSTPICSTGEFLKWLESTNWLKKEEATVKIPPPVLIRLVTELKAAREALHDGVRSIDKMTDRKSRIIYEVVR